jgi:hypothetical protein
MMDLKYRHTRYKIELRGSDRWLWSFHVGPALGRSGLATGSYDDANRACKRAIDTFLIEHPVDTVVASGVKTHD